jgi:hypothetical protein
MGLSERKKWTECLFAASDFLETVMEGDFCFNPSATPDDRLLQQYLLAMEYAESEKVKVRH